MKLASRWYRRFDEDYKSSLVARAIFMATAMGVGIFLADYLVDRFNTDFLIEFLGHLLLRTILGLAIGIPAVLAYSTVRRRTRS